MFDGGIPQIVNRSISRFLHSVRVEACADERMPVIMYTLDVAPRA